MATRPVGLAAQSPDIRTLIAERAYHKAEQRGFVPGYELDDWLAAEQEVGMIAANAKTKKPGIRKRVRAVEDT
jgi:hypothetical protein